MQKIIAFSQDDIIDDSRNVQDKLNSACSHRGTKYRLRGLCQIETHIYFFLLPKENDENNEDYVLAPLEEIPSHEDMIAILNDRWAAGFDLVGSIDIYNNLFMIYARRNN